VDAVDQNGWMLRRYQPEIVLVTALVVVSAFYARLEYIPSFADRHVAVAEEKYGFDVGEPGPWFSAWSLGDGQAYAMIAVDPTGDKLAEHVSEAGYRFARAGYGWSTWAFALGEPHLVPYALAAVGGLSLVGVLLVAIRIRRSLGARAWLLVLNPALFAGFAGDTSEPLGILMLAFTMAWGSWVAAVFLGVTRPTFLVGVWGRWRLFVPGVVAAASLALYSLFAFGAEALFPAGGRLALPFLAYVEHLSIWGLILAGVATATVILGIRERDWSWAMAGILVLCFGPDVLRDPINAWRAAGFIPVLWAFGPNFAATATSVPSLTSQDTASNRST
jgi:hypothetical protein